MALRFLSQYSGYLIRETGTVIGFIRKPEEFVLNRYVQYVEAESMYGAYMQLSYDDSVRLVDDRMYAWDDGDPSPRGEGNKHRFQFLPFKTRRRAYPWTVGYLSIKQASWRPKQVYMDDEISICMTARTQRIVNVLTSAANWGANTGSANFLNGNRGGFGTASDDPNSPYYNAIFRTMMASARNIFLFTNGKVRGDMLKFVVGPDLAIAMAESAEMTNYMRESPYAQEVLREGLGGAGKKQMQLWGLPPTYKGFELVVEDAPIVTENYAAPLPTGSLPQTVTEATTNRTFIWPTNMMAVVSRPGGLDGEYSTKSFSTMQLYHYQGLLKVEAFDDPKDQLVEGRVSENIIEILAAAPSGYLVTNC